MRIIPLFIGAILLCGCNARSNNQNTTKANVNGPAKKSNEVASTNPIPYSAPPSTRVSKEPPTAIEVAQVLKKANIFPKQNDVRENPISESDKEAGVSTSVNIASSRVEGMTVKVYQTSDQRNKARLQMVNTCPGCNSIVECGPIVMYEPSPNSRDLMKLSYKLSEERFGILKRYFHCE